MNPERWSKLTSLFDELSTLSPDDRLARLAAIRRTEPALADDLEALFEPDDGAHSAISGIVDSAISELSSEATKKVIGRSFGAYRVVSHLARGGMGDVYVAERDDGAFEQRVALKLIGRGTIADEAEARFAAERRILARLNHPNIARILDGGTTEDDVSWLAMELVDGEPIDDYCRRRALGIRARLELFRQVCTAIEFAHRNLIVHRDIKPTNILVTPEGVPKLLDFGIAKLLDDSGDEPDLTRAATRMLTPDFASPEQILGQPITTASDVYALGVLLFILLTGRKPYETAKLRPSELERLIVDTLPGKPSQAVLQTDDGGPPPDSARAVARRLRGDLDNIVLKMLRKEPGERYGSVHALSADLDRHLRGRPVDASGYAWAYVLRKFVQRNLVPVAAVSLALFASVAAALYHNLSITAERDRVRAEADKAAATAQFLVDIFKLSDPDESLGRTVTAKEILDTGAARLETDLAGQPATRAMLGTTIGEVYDNLGLDREALAQLQVAVRLREELGDQGGLAESLRALGHVQFEVGEFDAARATHERALAINRGLLPADHVDIAANLNDLGHAIYGAGDYDTAVAHYLDAIAMLERLDETSHPMYVDTLHDLGQVRQMQGDIAAAEANLRRAVDYALERYGERNTLTITYMHDLAVVLQEMGRLAEAEALYLEVNELEAAVLGEDHPSREATMTNTGRLYVDMNRLDDAEYYLRGAVDIAVRVRGPRHVFTAYDLVNLANLLNLKGDAVEAEAAYLEAIDIYEQELAPDHPYLASASVGYADLLNAVGRPRESLDLSDRALAICAASLPPGHWLAASANSVRGESLMLLGELDAAEPLLLDGYAGVAAARPGDRITINALERLVRYYELRDDAAEAGRYRELLAAAGFGEN